MNFGKLGGAGSSCRNRNLTNRRLCFEALEQRQLLVIAAFDPFDPQILTPLTEFMGVGQIVRDPELQLQVGCTGSLLPSGRQVLTAAHCAIDYTDGQVWYVKFVTDSAQPTDPYTFFPFKHSLNPTANDVFIHPAYLTTLDPKKGHDLAIIDLVPEQCDAACQSNLAILDTLPRYDIFRETDDSDLNAEVDIVGYGLTGVGANGVQSFDGLSEMERTDLTLSPMR